MNHSSVEIIRYEVLVKQEERLRRQMDEQIIGSPAYEVLENLWLITKKSRIKATPSRNTPPPLSEGLGPENIGGQNETS
jgi:hypothetical protein